MTKLKKHNKLSRIIGISFGILLLLITSAFIYLLKILDVIPNDYFIYGAIILGVITLTIAILLSIRGHVIIKSVCYVLWIVLVLIYSFGIYYLNKTMNFIENIDLIREEVTKYYVIVLKDAKYEEISDLDNTSIAYFNMMEQAVLDKIKLDIDFTSIKSIDDLKKDLYDKKVEAILVSDIVKNKLEDDYENFSQETRIIETISIKNTINDITKKVAMKNTPFNVLISGIDGSGDINQTGRNDVNIVATINPNTNEILLTSIPRDYYIQLHGTTGLKDKLTHASYYGTNMAVATIEDLLDTDINYYVRVNFDTVVSLVDELNGVDVYADQALWIGNCYFKEGYNHVNGRCALAFSRERHSYADGDLHRGRNQQEVIRAVFAKIASGTTILTEYNDLLRTLNGKFVTNMDMNEALNYVKYELNDFKNYKIIDNQVASGGSGSDYTYSYPDIKLWIMIPNEESIKKAHELIANMLKKK